MPEYLSPGVYIQEVDTGPRPIEGVGTAMAAFVGFAPSGPANQPVLITNWSQYVDTFGSTEDGGRRNPHLSGAYLSHAVHGYFLNGGGRCYVARIAPGDGRTNGKGAASKLPAAQIPGRSAKGLASLTATAKTTPSADIQIEVTPPTATGEEPAPEGTFTLKIRMGATEETYENVSLAKRGAKNVVETVNQASKLVTLLEVPGQASLAERTPGLGTYTLKGPEQTAVVPQIKSQHFVGEVTERSGLEGLEVADDVTMVCCPDVFSAFPIKPDDTDEAKKDALDKIKSVQLAMIAHCERLGDRIALIDPPPGLTPQQMKKWRERDSNYDSKYAALYYPWIRVDGPDGSPIDVPPSGYIAGVYARNDNERGVHKAPANEVIRGALSPEIQITKGEQDVLNPLGVNCIRTFVGRGIRVWGARTLSSDPAWRYVSVRRLFNYVEESIERGTQWVVFEPNDADLWARVRRDVGAFLTGVWRDGMLFGATPAEAFFVKCDAENNPSDVRDRGQLIIDIGMAPVKPAEFIVFRFSQYAGGGA
ncbi:MAG TPA: phage tail sheath family protein [Gemmatimonadales bacterium]|jgi:phage tail sheath protein FI